MKRLFLSALVWFVFGSSVTLAESVVQEPGYRVPVFGNLQLEAESTGSGKVYLSWSAFDGYKNEDFQYYKIVRSHSNPNPVYPEDDGIGWLDGLGETRFTDSNAWKSAYYRVCVITDVKGRHCSNVVWIDIKKPVDSSCKNLAADGSCEDKTTAWQHKPTVTPSKPVDKVQTWTHKKETPLKHYADKKPAAPADDRWKKLYEKLDNWLERFGERLENSSLTNTERVAKIEKIQTRFYSWEKGSDIRMRIVDHLDKTLNHWKELYSQEAEFGDIDDFLEGLLSE